MSNRAPSMTALLGLLAVAGYQNRDKISEMIKNATASVPSGSGTGTQSTPLGGLLGNLGGMLGGAGAGGLLSGGLGELLTKFQQNGQGDTAQSWVNPANLSPGFEAGDRTGCPGNVGTTNWALSGGCPRATFARATGSCRQIHARGSVARPVRPRSAVRSIFQRRS
jgi:uncharacterized protein YidB (DUF937 family)